MENRTIFPVNLSRQERAMLTDLAELEGLSRAEWIRTCVRAAHKLVVGSKRVASAHPLFGWTFGDPFEDEVLVE